MGQIKYLVIVDSIPHFLEKKTKLQELHRIEVAFRRPPDHIAAILLCAARNPTHSHATIFLKRSTDGRRRNLTGRLVFTGWAARARGLCWRLFCSPAFCHMHCIE